MNLPATEQNNSVLSWCSVFHRPWRLPAPCSRSVLRVLGLCLDYTSCVTFGPLCAWGHTGCVLAGTPHSGEEAGPCKTRAPGVVVQVFPTWNLDLQVKSLVGKIIFLQMIFEGAGCGRALLYEYISIHGKSKWCFLAQDITQWCKDWESSVYKCSTNMTHTFYSHELVLPMIKSRNASLNGFTYIIGLCSCYHFFLVYEKWAICSDGIGLELLSAFVRHKSLKRKSSQLPNSAVNAAGNQGSCRSPPINIWVATQMRRVQRSKSPEYLWE